MYVDETGHVTGVGCRVIGVSVASQVHVSVLKDVTSDDVYAASIVDFDEFKQRDFNQTLRLGCRRDDERK